MKLPGVSVPKIWCKRKNEPQSWICNTLQLMRLDDTCHLWILVVFFFNLLLVWWVEVVCIYISVCMWMYVHEYVCR